MGNDNEILDNKRTYITEGEFTQEDLDRLDKVPGLVHVRKTFLTPEQTAELSEWIKRQALELKGHV